MHPAFGQIPSGSGWKRGGPGAREQARSRPSPSDPRDGVPRYGRFCCVPGCGWNGIHESVIQQKGPNPKDYVLHIKRDSQKYHRNGEKPRVIPQPWLCVVALLLVWGSVKLAQAREQVGTSQEAKEGVSRSTGSDSGNKVRVKKHRANFKLLEGPPGCSLRRSLGSWEWSWRRGMGHASSCVWPKNQTLLLRATVLG